MRCVNISRINIIFLVAILIYAVFIPQGCAMANPSASGGGSGGSSGSGIARNDAAEFKHEYEALNGQTAPDGEHVYKSIAIPADNPFIYIEGEGVINTLAPGGDASAGAGAGGGAGVIFMGFPECPWCRTLLPALISACEKSGYAGPIHYYNALADRDVLKLSDDGEIVTVEAGAQVYHDLVVILYNHLSPYKGLNDDTIKRIYLPTTVFYKDGVITSVHLTTIESQESGYDELTDAQFAELENRLIEEFRALTG